MAVEGEGVEGGSGTSEAPEWLSGIEDVEVKDSLSRFADQKALFGAIGYTPPTIESAPDWREGIKDAKAREFADSSTDVNHLVQRALDMRQKLSNAVVIPGKDASDEDRATYRKAAGIPDSPEGYEFPELPKELLTDAVKESRSAWAARFHELGVPGETAKALIAAVNEESEREMESQKAADKTYADEQITALKSQWKGEAFGQNATIAKNAIKSLAERAGVNVDDLNRIEMGDGKFLMDRAEVIRLFAVVGREMGEGNLGPTLTNSERETVDEQVRDVRKQIEEAKSEGDSKRANQLYQREQELLAKIGNEPIVGAQGRAA